MVYISLVRDFLGYYVEFEYNEEIPDEAALRKYMNAHYRAWWCAIYKEIPPDPYCTPKIITLNQLESKIAASDALYEYTRIRNVLFKEFDLDHFEQLVEKYKKLLEENSF